MDKVALCSVTRTVQRITWSTVVLNNNHVYFAHRSVMWVGLSGAAAFGITWAGVEAGVFWTLLLAGPLCGLSSYWCPRVIWLYLRSWWMWVRNIPVGNRIETRGKFLYCLPHCWQLSFPVRFLNWAWHINDGEFIVFWNSHSIFGSFSFKNGFFILSQICLSVAFPYWFSLTFGSYIEGISSVLRSYFDPSVSLFCGKSIPFS